MSLLDKLTKKFKTLISCLLEKKSGLLSNTSSTKSKDKKEEKSKQDANILKNSILKYKKLYINKRSLLANLLEVIMGELKEKQ